MLVSWGAAVPLVLLFGFMVSCRVDTSSLWLRILGVDQIGYGFSAHVLGIIGFRFFDGFDLSHRKTMGPGTKPRGD